MTDEQLPLAALGAVAGPDHAHPAAPSDPPFVDHLGNVAARKVGIPGWRWYTSEVVDTGGEPGTCDFLLTGSVPRSLTRGPRKGQLTFKGCDLTRVVVTRAELDTELARHEAVTGRCHRCDGSGRVVTSAHVNPDQTLTKRVGACSRCGRSGRPPGSEAATP